MQAKITVMSISIFIVLFLLNSAIAREVCISCHKTVTPGLVKDWETSKHREMDVTCSVCHGEKTQ
ncbi:hypothetical protein DMNBHIDG_00246 [Candidatus Methanoperedenaceae archaeon GB37]|nr:hypothetical protein DMNBHIDG_00246 [Candidatus Methanoperedenaceae archaeon GB37]